MKQKLLGVIWFTVMVIIGCGVSQLAINTNELLNLQSGKAILEIQKLKHELKAYEEMDKDLKSE